MIRRNQGEGAPGTPARVARRRGRARAAPPPAGSPAASGTPARGAAASCSARRSPRGSGPGTVVLARPGPPPSVVTAPLPVVDRPRAGVVDGQRVERGVRQRLRPQLLVGRGEDWYHACQGALARRPRRGSGPRSRGRLGDEVDRQPRLPQLLQGAAARTASRGPAPRPPPGRARPAAAAASRRSAGGRRG